MVRVPRIALRLGVRCKRVSGTEPARNRLPISFVRGDRERATLPQYDVPSAGPDLCHGRMVAVAFQQIASRMDLTETRRHGDTEGVPEFAV